LRTVRNTFNPRRDGDSTSKGFFMKFVRSASALAMAAASACPAFAEAPVLAALDAANAAADAAADSAAAGEGSEEEQPAPIVVTGARERYGADRTSSATRTDTPLQDVPQSVSVVSEQQIEDQNLRSVADVLRYVPGATAAQGEGHRDQIVLRGNNSTSDFFVDGLRDDIQYYRPLYNLERIEVLRGPNAMIFGRGGGGGVVNRVTKQPFFQDLTGASASLNTFGAWHVDADVNVPIGTGIALRFNGIYEEFASHRDVYEGELLALNPAARLLIGPETGVTLSYEYVDDSRVVDRGIPSRAGRPLEGFRDTFFGQPGTNRLGFEAHILKGMFDHRFSDNLTLVSRVLYADYDKFYVNAFPASAVSATNQVGIEAYVDSFQRENLFSQTDLVWEVTTGALKHTLLAGIEIGHQETGNQRLNGFFDSGVPTTNNRLRTNAALSDPIVIPPITFRPGSGQRSTASEAEIFAVYFQDQIEVGPVELIGGLRYDRFRLDAVNLLNGQAFSRTDDLWSPRIGIVVHPVEPVSLYASYSRSFLPQSGDQFNSLDLTSAALEPEKFDNYEVGVKWQATAGLLLSAALYQLERTNTRAAGPNPGEVVLTGAQRSRGLEIEAVGEIMPNWQLTLAYTLQEAQIVQNTSAAPAGRHVALVPEHQFAAWTRYDFHPRFGAGIGLLHQSESFASISNAVVLPAFTRVDLGLFVKLTDRIEAQVNVENLLDEDYFPTAHNDNNITPGAPLNARLTVRLGF
jgi:catecholate siderophore receptor